MRFLIILSILILAACSKEPEKTANINNEPVMVQQSSVKTENDSSKEPKEAEQITLTPKEARDFAVNLYKKIEEDEQFIRDSAELGEYQSLEQYDRDWYNYVNTAYNYNEGTDVIRIGYAFWPNSEQVAPYTKCEAALIDLKILSNAVSHLMREDTAVLRKIVRQEEQDYLRSKAACKKRVKMTYVQAVAAENAEYQK